MVERAQTGATASSSAFGVVAGIAASAAALLAGGALAMLYGIASEQGRHAERLEVASKERAAIVAAVEEARRSLEEEIGSLADENRREARALEDKIDRLALSVRASQMEVAPILANLGVIDWPATKIETVVVGPDVWMFPADAESSALLEASGFRRETLAHSISGYRVAPVEILFPRQ